MYKHKNNIELIKIDADDLHWMRELKDDSWYGTHRITILNIDDQKQWYESIRKDSTILIMKAVLDSKYTIGLFKLFHIDYTNRSCEVGWDIVAEYRGKGYGKKIVESGTDFCFEVMNMNRLTAEILNNNVASQKCALSNSYIQEGCKRQAVIKCNQILDSFIYGIIFTDWNLKLTKFNGTCNKLMQINEKKNI